MNVLVFAPYGLWTPPFEEDLEIIQCHLDQGDNVTVLVCDGSLAACDPNPGHEKTACMKCISRREAGLKLFSPPVRTVALTDLVPDWEKRVQELKTEFTSIAELKNYRIGNFDIGAATLSSLFSLHHDSHIDLENHGAEVRAFLLSAWRVYLCIQRYLQKHPVEKVYAFNCRYAPLRGTLRACQERGIQFVTHDKGPDTRRYVLYPNCMPHDRAFNDASMHQLWNEAQNDDVKRREIGARWYEERSKGIFRKEKCHTQHQKADRLPADWNPQKRNVAIFLSSEHEFAAVGREWENPLYPSQMDGIQSIVDSLRPKPGNLHLYIRVHPNLAKATNRQTSGIATIREPFVTVIPANDPVSSYALLRHSNKVLTFGSTIGIESVYWGIPSILAGMSYYRNLGATYNPQTHQELMELIEADLQPTDREKAIIYGYYRSQEGIEFKYYTASGLHEGKFKGVKIAAHRLVRVRIELYKGWKRVRSLLGKIGAGRSE